MTDKQQDKPDWKKARDKKRIVASATQFETLDLCPRKWWFDKVRRLFNGGSTKSQVLGTVLHSVAERYLRADDLGRDPETGKAVELFPEGWHVAESRFGRPSEGEITPAEQGLVKALVQAAIEGGVLQRVPGRTIERQFNLPVTVHDGVRVDVTGFIDYDVPDGVQDHKTTSNPRYIKSANPKSPNWLGRNLQMLVYAHAKIESLKAEKLPVPDKITLRHNVYITKSDPPQVRKVETQVETKRVEAFWETVVERAKQMVAIRRIDEWHKVPGPRSTDACNAYGGCPFRSICGGKETIKEYEDRLAIGQTSGYITPTVTQNPNPNSERTGSMPDFNSRLAALTNRKKLAAGSTPAAPTPGGLNPPDTAPKQQPAEAPRVAPAIEGKVAAPEPAVPDSDSLVSPPWADPGCTVCKGIGFNSSGSPCRMCALRAKKGGRVPPDEYLIQPNSDGTATWIRKSDDSEAGISPMSLDGPAPVKTVEKVTAPSPAAAEEAPGVLQPGQTALDASTPPVAKDRPKVEVPPAPDEAPETATEEQETDPEEPEVVGSMPLPGVARQQQARPHDTAAPVVELPPAKRGRPPKGFILLVNCAAVSGGDRKGSGRYVHDLNEVFLRYTDHLAKEIGVDSFYDIKSFDRRDMLAKAAPSLVEYFGTDMVCVTGLSSGQGDMKALVDALRPHASMVLVGVDA